MGPRLQNTCSCWGGAQTASAAPWPRGAHGGQPLRTEVVGWSGGSPAGLPFLRLVDDVADLHVEGPVLALQGAIGSFL